MNNIMSRQAARKAGYIIIVIATYTVMSKIIIDKGPNIKFWFDRLVYKHGDR